MKKLILAVLFAAVPMEALAAHDVKTAWDLPIGSQVSDLKEYRIYKTTTKGTYSLGSNFTSVPPATPAYTLIGVSDTVPTWAAVTAVGQNGMESPISNELYLLAPAAPANFRVVP
jgi:hypothetical protein